MQMMTGSQDHLEDLSSPPWHSVKTDDMMSNILQVLDNG